MNEKVLLGIASVLALIGGAYIAKDLIGNQQQPPKQQGNLFAIGVPRIE